MSMLTGFIKRTGTQLKTTFYVVNKSSLFLSCLVRLSLLGSVIDIARLRKLPFLTTILLDGHRVISFTHPKPCRYYSAVVYGWCKVKWLFSNRYPLCTALQDLDCFIIIYSIAYNNLAARVYNLIWVCMFVCIPL